MNRQLLFLCGFVCLTLLPPAAAQDLVQKAQKAFDAGDYQAAFDLLRDGFDTIVKDPVGLTLLADSSLNLGDYEAAISYSTRACRDFPQHAPAFRTAALAFFWRGDAAKQENTTLERINGFYEASRDHNRKYLEMKPEDAEMWSLQGYTFDWLGDHAAGAEAFARCTKIQPSEVGYWVSAVSQHQKAKNWSAGLNLLEEADKVHPKNPFLGQARGELLVAQGTDASDAKLMAQGAAVFVNVLKSSGGDAAVERVAAQGVLSAFAPNENWKAATAAMQEWEVAAPKNALASEWVGYFAHLAGDYEAAKKAYEKVFQASGKRNAGAAVGVAAAYHASGVGKTGDGKPNFDDVQDLKALRTAVEWYVVAEKIDWNWGDPANRPMRRVFNLFLGCANSNKVAEGVALVEDIALPAAPKDWRLLNVLGLYYRDLGGSRRGSEGKQLCKKSLDYYVESARQVVADPEATGSEKASILNDAGVLYHFPQYQIKDMEMGFKYYRDALTHDPSWKDANENVGICLNAMGRHADAIPYLEKVLEQEPNRMVSRRQLEQAKRALGGK